MIPERQRTSSTDRCNVRQAGTLALVGFAFWVLVVVALPVLTTDVYDPVEQSISALTLVRFGWSMDAAFFAFGLGTLALAFGLSRCVDRASTGVSLLAVCGVLWSLLGVFRTGSGVFGGVHDAFATASFLLVCVAMLLFARRFGNDGRWRSFARPTAIWAVLAVGALCSIPILDEEAFGVSERVFVATFVSWTVATATRLRGM